MVGKTERGVMTRSSSASARLEKPKRRYHPWVFNENSKDYSLRYTSKFFRKWSKIATANTALGDIYYLANFGIGGSFAISSEFANSFWAIWVSAIIIFVTGVLISYYAAKYNIDMDLLARGVGFGYIGSSFITLGLAFILSLIVAIFIKGKYYIARKDVHCHDNPNLIDLATYSICKYEYEKEDMAYCPVYNGSICSLCCSFDALCHDACNREQRDIITN